MLSGVGRTQRTNTHHAHNIRFMQIALIIIKEVQQNMVQHKKWLSLFIAHK